MLIVSSSVYARGGGGHSHSSGSSVKSNSASHSPSHTTGGPIVKTGPTKGQVRSRNQDGTWRQKRSDAQ